MGSVDLFLVVGVKVPDWASERAEESHGHPCWVAWDYCLGVDALFSLALLRGHAPSGTARAWPLWVGGSLGRAVL